MIRRSLAILIAVLALSAGAAAAWVALSVPRDVRAEALLKDARAMLQKGERDAARAALQDIVKNYPRTDAASAASYALFRLYEQERTELRARVDVLEQEAGRQSQAMTADAPAREQERERVAEIEKKLADLEQKVGELSKTSTKRRR